MRAKATRDCQSFDILEVQRFTDDALQIWRSVRSIGCVSIHSRSKSPAIHAWAARDGMRIMTDNKSVRSLLWLPDVHLMPLGAVFGSWQKTGAPKLVSAANYDVFETPECQELARTVMQAKRSIVQHARTPNP